MVNNQTKFSGIGNEDEGVKLSKILTIINTFTSIQDT